jgi:large subunit ribosomal protein L18
MAQKKRADIRRGVHTRIRKKVSGTAERPRLAVFRSLNHIYAQVIDDVNGKTLAAASTTEKELKGGTGGNIEAAVKVGKTVAERALAAGVSTVVFDRGGYLYHGRVKALLDATREAGLNKSETAQEEVEEESNEN